MNYLSLCSSLFPFILGVRYFYQLEVNSRIIVVLCAFSSISQFAKHIFTHKGYVWLTYNCYSIIDPLLWGIIMIHNSESRQIRKLIRIMWITELILVIARVIDIGITVRFVSENVCLNNIVQPIWVLIYIYEKQNKEEIIALERDPLFWFCMGILIYGPPTYFSFAFYDVITDPTYPGFKDLWTIHDYINSAMYILFSMGIWTNIAKIKKRQPWIRKASLRDKGVQLSQWK